MALSEWSFKNQLGQKRTTHDKSKFEDDKLLKQVITFTVANSFQFQKAMCCVNEIPATPPECITHCKTTKFLFKINLSISQYVYITFSAASSKLIGLEY